MSLFIFSSFLSFKCYFRMNNINTSYVFFPLQVRLKNNLRSCREYHTSHSTGPSFHSPHRFSSQVPIHAVWLCISSLSSAWPEQFCKCTKFGRFHILVERILSVLHRSCLVATITT